MKENIVTEYKVVEFSLGKTLVGMKIESNFPGFNAKAQWLAQSFEKLANEVTAIEEMASFYFVYHGIEHAPMVCVDWIEDIPVPGGLKTIRIDPQKFAVFMHRGRMASQEETFIDICNTEFNQNHNGIHFEVHNRKALEKASTEHFKLPIYLPMVYG